MASDESGVKKKVKALLNKRGGWFYMPVQTGYGVAGIPDFICCYKGRLLAIETKYGRNTPTPLQIRQLTQIMLAGGVSCVINENNIDRLGELLDAIEQSPAVAGFGWVTIT